MPDGRSQGDSPILRATRFVRREGTRIVIGIAGGLIVIVGVVLMPLPGPGMLIVLAGLAVLATQFAWAQDLLDRARDRARDVIDRLRGGPGDDPRQQADGRPHADEDIDGPDADGTHLGSGAVGGRSDVA